MLVTDLDGTLLRSDLTVSQRTRDVLARLTAAGIPVVPATARQVRGINMLVDQIPFAGWAITSNGAVVVHLHTGEVLAEATLTEQVQRAFASAVLDAAPDTVFFGVRDAGTSAAAEAGYQSLSRYNDHKRHPSEWEVMDRDALLGLPNNKVAIRHPDLPVLELHQIVRALDLPEVTVSHSGAPFLDVTAAGVSKAWGLNRLGAYLGITPDEVVAFGDELNDVSMLTLAGHAVAMQHAGPAVRAIADRIAPDNDDDGLAQVVDDLITAGWFGALTGCRPARAGTAEGG